MAVAAVTKALVSRTNLKPGLIWDAREKGFGVRVNKHGRAVSYVHQKSGANRVVLGRVGDLDPEEARRLAKAKSVEHGATEASARVSLQEALDLHITSMLSRGCRQASADLMRREVERHAAPLLRQRVDRLTHAQIVQTYERALATGTASANRTLRHLRAIANTVDAPWRLSRSWKGRKPDNKTGKEPVRDLVAFGDALRALDNPVVRAWWLTVALTGLRRADALAMRWADVEAGREGWILRPDPKRHAGAKKPFEIPITTPLREVLDTLPGGEWVFPGHVRGRHLSCPEKPEIDVRPHRLRATFATEAHALGCPERVAMRLLNHTSRDSAHSLYVSFDDETVALWAERIALSLWRKMGFSEE